MLTIRETREIIESWQERSAWARGVQAYALELCDQLAARAEYERREPADRAELKAWALNGAQNWQEYSADGRALAHAAALVYDGDIAERLCTPSALKRCRGGERRPNGREDWIRVQGRALAHAAALVYRAAMTSPEVLREMQLMQAAGLYATRYAAQKDARGGDVVVKVEGGYKIMTAQEWQIWLRQK